MAIRLQLTLLYSMILIMAIVLFSVVLYASQSQSTLDVVERELQRIHGRSSDPNGVEDPPRDPAAPEPPPPFAPDLPSGRFNQPLVQMRTTDGAIVQRSESLGEVSLPLSSGGLTAVIAGEPWYERALLEDEWFLILSQLDLATADERRIIQVALPVGTQIEYLDQLRTRLILGDSIIVLIAAVVGWTVAGLSLRPIRRISQTARLVGEERDFSRRIQQSGPNDEIGELATTFNEMLAQLQQAYEQVEQALDAQRRFVADASHELRTPLTTIQGNIELLRRRPPLESAEQTEILEDTADETARLTRLVHDLLSLARADAEQGLAKERLTVAPLLVDVCRQAETLSDAHTIVSHADPALAVEANVDAMRQILLILLDNAVKHTLRGTVEVVAAGSDGRVVISVADEGPGIDTEALPHLFDRFYRGDSARTGPGAGLGLSIAKELAEALGGTLAVESRLGAGTRFTINLPAPLSSSVDLDFER